MGAIQNIIKIVDIDKLLLYINGPLDATQES